MPYTIQDLIFDILPRVGQTKTPGGINIFSAANSILSLVYKKLLDRRSDLLVGDFSLSIPALGYTATLPLDFLSMAERPRSVDVLTDWMAGTVTSYDSVTGVLVVNVTVASGTDTLLAWSIALGALPGEPATTIGTSTTSLTVGTGSKTLTTQPNLSITIGQYVIVSASTLPLDWEMRQHRVDPSYLDDDEDHLEYTWWEWYGIYGESWEPPSLRPRRYKIFGTTIYVRPKVIVNVIITGKYNQKPVSFSKMTDEIPWNGFFDEIFREGSVRIIQKGVSIPEADSDFVLFMNNQFDTIINSRIYLMPQNRRLKRANWM